jgi:hypothetical protein
MIWDVKTATLGSADAQQLLFDGWDPIGLNGTQLLLRKARLLTEADGNTVAEMRQREAAALHASLQAQDQTAKQGVNLPAQHVSGGMQHATPMQQHATPMQQAQTQRATPAAVTKNHERQSH